MRRITCTLALLALVSVDSTANQELLDYRYLRALSIDFLGRAPTRHEIAQFERGGTIDHWLDRHLQGPDYAARLRRVYMDLLRLELPETAAVFKPSAILLHRANVLDANGRPLVVYFREAQRRADPAIDGHACFTEAESGVDIRVNGRTTGSPRPIAQALLDARTVVVKPWWLYADYRAADPRDRLAADWITKYPGYELVESLFVDPDGTPTTAIRVCREEAQVADTGLVFATGRAKSTPLPPGRKARMPLDTAFAKQKAGTSIACASHTGYQSSTECGCGVGLERCLPSGPAGFVTPTDTPIGASQPFSKTPRPAVLWLRAWWAEEVTHFLDRIFLEDRDVREILTSRTTQINGPLALFYRHLAGVTCCGPGVDLGYPTAREALFDPAAIPRDLPPQQTAKWIDVDRGKHAAGLMTMPVFLLKYGSRRQRAHAIYKAFTCKEFVADTMQVTISNEPDLRKRPGCAGCHIKLEPLAAYFARVEESDWTYLPSAQFPTANPQCATQPAKMSAACRTFYDPELTTPRHSPLRGAYAAPQHADLGPAGLAKAITSSPDFAPCVVRNVAESLLGRPLDASDEPWKRSLTKIFVDGGYRMRALVRAIVTSPAYRDLDDRKLR